VSSDSDFTRLAQRIREEGLTVYGFGEEKTPEPFVALATSPDAGCAPPEPLKNRDTRP
jgi:hypothetical protein